AREHLERACSLNPGYTGALNNLGVVYRELDLREDAERVLLQAVALEPGDIISTGTISGVGATTGTFLKPGDRVEIEISKIGVLKNNVAASKK
ncbi:MAG: fumarylacetoacetate hydrolase family protein, partial [Candidatus Latescibacteria bacterium]|nr:fumarylacetoacetate hydrolase family protein [Candidatus Latescibacterota bacterium]